MLDLGRDNRGAKSRCGRAVGECGSHLGDRDREQRHRGGGADQAELAEPASKQRSQEWCERDDVDGADSTANVLEA